MPPMRRRRFLVRSLELLLLPLAGVVAGMLRRQAALPERQAASLLVEVPPEPGVELAGPVIVCARAGRLSVLSSRCPHLGCRIDRVDGEALVCPCHGSRFAWDGSLQRGPATGPLQALPFAAEADRRHLRIDLPPA